MSRANGYTSYRGSSRDTRPSSAELVDLHVYIVPPDIWRERYNNFLNQHVTETISAGIIRVHPEHKVYGLRDELEQQVGAELLPRDYVFLKSVGRSITRLKPKQEYQLKAKHFIPPQAYAPELYLLEVGPGDRESSRTSTRPQTQSPISYTNNQESEDERQSASKVKQSESSPYRYSPLPKIRSARGPEKTENSSQRGEYNYNGDVKAENGRLSDSLSSSNRDRQSPTPQHMSRSPLQSHSSPPRQQTPREESQRAPQEDSNRSIRVPREHSQQSQQFQKTLPEGSQQFQKTQRSLREGSQQFTKDEPRQAHSSTSPTPSTDHRRRPEHREPVGDSYTNHTNEDSGINVNSPEDHFDALDRRKPNDDGNDDLQRRLQPDRNNDDSDRQRREDQDQDEWERKRREEEERRRYQDEEHRRREEQERQREEDDRRRLEEERSRVPKQQLTGSDERTNDQSRSSRISENYLPRESTQSVIRDRASSPNVVVQINDEINGVLTPRVIVQVNSGSNKQNTNEEDSYFRNRLKVENGYQSDRYDSDHNKSVRSYRNDGYQSDYSSNEGQSQQFQSVNSKTFVNSASHRQTSENQSQRESEKALNSRNEDGIKNGANRFKPKEVSWSDGKQHGRPVQEQRGIVNSTKEEHADKSTTSALNNSSEINRQNGTNGDNSKFLEVPKQEHSFINSNTVKPRSENRQNDANVEISKSLEVPKHELSFIKSDTETITSTVVKSSRISSGYQGDVSDTGVEDGQRMKKDRKDLNRFPSPPPMQIHDTQQKDTESGKQNRKAEKERLLKELEAAREARRAVEKQREELVKKAKLMQTKTQNRRNHARDLWKKRYFEEKKKTPPLEEQCNRLRHELDIIHRKLMNTLEGPSKEKSTRLGDLQPSQKNNYKIQATRLTHEIDDMRRRVENAKMKLTAEMKLRNQAETELRALRAELTQQKISLTLSRNQQMAAFNTPAANSSEMMAASAYT